MNVQFEEDKYVSRTSQGVPPKSIIYKIIFFLVGKGIISDVEKAKKIVLITSVLFVLISTILFISSLGEDYTPVDVEGPRYLPAE